MNDIAGKISEMLKIRDVMEYYGIRFNNNGFAKCPFHNEKTASLSIKKNHYKCFGCGAYGGVIDFVMIYFGLSFRQALVRLDSDFKLGLISYKTSHRKTLTQAENGRIERAFDKWQEQQKAKLKIICDVRRLLFRRYCYGEIWLAELIERYDEILNAEEVRLWQTIMK